MKSFYERFRIPFLAMIGVLLSAALVTYIARSRSEEVLAQPTFVTSDNTVKNRLLVRVDLRVFKLINTDSGAIVGSYANTSTADFTCDGSRLILFDKETRDVTVVDSVSGNIIAVADAGDPSGTIFQIEEYSCNPDTRMERQL